MRKFYSRLSILLFLLIGLLFGMWSAAIPVTTASICPAANFNAAPTFPVGSEPLFVASGDFNGDGNPDLAVSNDHPDDDILILIGDGTGRYSSASRIKSPALIPFGFIAVGDFNNDGKQDLAATYVGYGGVFIMLGDGQGAFSTPVSHPAGVRPQIIVVADFNADGRHDLAVGERESTPDFTYHLSILLGTSGGLGAARAIQVRTAPQSLDAGDINGDGKIDLIAGGGHSSSVLFGDGTGNFSLLALGFDANIGPVVKIADFNNDNKADIVMREEVGFTHVLYGDGAGGFPTRIPLDVFAATGAVVGDFNGDGRVDIAMVRSAGVAVLLGATAGGFERKDYAAGSRPNGIAKSDVNKDGKLDLVVLNLKSYDVSIFVGTGTGDFAAAPNYLTQSPGVTGSPTGIASGDFNRDGKLDMAVTNFHSRDVVVFIGDGRGGFISGTIYSVAPALPTSLAVSDVDGDGNLDILVTFNQGGNLGRLFGRGDGTFQSLTIQALQVNAATSVTTGDFNGDGKPDIAMLGFNGLMIALNVAEGSFGPSKSFVVGESPISSSLGDLNGDGKLDVIVPKTNGIHAQLDGLWIGLGDGAGGITSSRIMQVGSAPWGATIGDFNGDSKADIAVAAVAPPNFGGVSIFIGDGNGEFTLRESHETAHGHREIAVGDFNADGALDLAVIGVSWNAVSILLGQGNGSFSAATNYGTGAEPRHLTIGDFNGDGKSDAMVSNFTSGDVTALLSIPCVVATPTPTPTPTPAPSPTPAGPPVLMTQENSNRAIAFDSVTLLAEPFSLQTDSNFSPDHRSRIIFFARNADLLPGENSSAVTVNGIPGGQNFPMTVEYVGKVSGMDWLTQIVVRLPDQLPSGDILVSISLHGMNSNQAVIKIR